MRLFELTGPMALLCCLSALPLAAHDNCHGDHHSYSQGGCQNCGQNYKQGAMRESPAVVDPSVAARLQTVEGKITEVVYLPGAAPESAMVEVRLQSGGQTTLIKLAPSGYLRNSGMRLREGETIAAKGFLVMGLEGDLIVATEIHQGDRNLSLRDIHGRSGW